MAREFFPDRVRADDMDRFRGDFGAYRLGLDPVS
jgi:hypothetical protein